MADRQSIISLMLIAADSHMFLLLQRDIDGRIYYEFEFATKAKTYIRHALAVVTVANGKVSLDSKRSSFPCLECYLRLTTLYVRYAYCGC